VPESGALEEWGAKTVKRGKIAGGPSKKRDNLERVGLGFNQQDKGQLILGRNGNWKKQETLQGRKKF